MLQQSAAGLLLWARQVGDIDRLLHGRRRGSTGLQLRTRPMQHLDAVAWSALGGAQVPVRELHGDGDHGFPAVTAVTPR